MRKICVFTATRAEYGPLRRVIRRIDKASDLLLQLVVSGTHIVAGQGMTINDIRADGFEPDHVIDIHLSDDSPAGICRSMGIAIAGYGQSLSQLQPDILIVLGDRYEALCCAAAAQICNIPIAHIHGGESTVGSNDEAFRHSITKMAHLHFPSCEEYRRRIIQLGESPERVFNVGALGVENIQKMKLLNKLELEKTLGRRLDRPFFLITLHPPTLESDNAGKQCSEFLAALEHFSGDLCLFTLANADSGGQLINTMINHHASNHAASCIVSPSLGSLRYLSALKLCKAIIGNSSSGIIEAPSFKIPTVNIGDRQKGRVRASSVIDCGPNSKEIFNAIQTVTQPAFQNVLRDTINPYHQSDTADQILRRISQTNLMGIMKKPFYDLTIEKPGDDK